MANQYHDAFVMAHRVEGSPYDAGAILRIRPGLTLIPIIRDGKPHGDWHIFCPQWTPRPPEHDVIMYMGFCKLRVPTPDGRQKSHLWLWGDRLVSINPNVVASNCIPVRRSYVSKKASRQASVS